MNDAVLTAIDVKATIPSAFAPGPIHAADSQEEVSVAGVMLLSAMSVLMAIMAMVSFALIVVGCWWLVSHIPVPGVVHQLAAKFHLSRG